LGGLLELGGKLFDCPHCGEPIGTKEAMGYVLAAFHKTKGDEMRAADEIQVPRRTLIYWKNGINALFEGIEKIRDKYGWE